MERKFLVLLRRIHILNYSSRLFGNAISSMLLLC